VISCIEAGHRTAFYVDHELSGIEALEFEAHLTECRECRLAYEDLRDTVDAVRLAAPLYEIPERSYARVEQLVREHSQRRKWWLPAIAAAIVLALVAGSTFSRRAAMPSQYESFAAEAHLRYARGSFPLDVVSREPQVVSDWLGQRLPFSMKLPNYPAENREQKRYHLVGARLMQYLDEDVAYLAYEMGGKPISLLIASSRRIRPSGGEISKSGGLTFHSSVEEGLRMITWTDKGLTYALASTLDEGGAESCVICHGSTNDRPKFEHLRQRRESGGQRF
jgi:anti-sigma factor RsiW